MRRLLIAAIVAAVVIVAAPERTSAAQKLVDPELPTAGFGRASEELLIEAVDLHAAVLDALPQAGGHCLGRDAVDQHVHPMLQARRLRLAPRADAQLEAARIIRTFSNPRDALAVGSEAA